MPIGISGNNIETFTQRVWIANQAEIYGSAPGVVSDFGVPDGAVIFTSADSFLKAGYTNLTQSNGFLYLTADSSINYVAGVNTSGTPPTTTLTNQNVDPQIGSSWGNSVQVYSRAVTFANPFGVHVIYGGAVEKVSSPLDGLFNTSLLISSTASAQTFQPSSAVAIIFGIHVYMLLMPIINPVSGYQQNALLMWDGKHWWTAAPSVPLVDIRTQENNSVMQAWGSDGVNLYPLFQTPSATLQKVVQSKLWDIPSYIFTKHISRIWGLLQSSSNAEVNLQISLDTDTSSQTIDVSNLFTIDWTNNSGSTVIWSNKNGMTINWTISGRIWFNGACDASGVLVGLTLTSTSEDFTLLSIILGVNNYTPNI